ncbi:MAG: hypothetical protein GXP32_04590 [Kiritimatiellaeota bacterium]|nr:hypothetical protein [Kiritimatiellota bacterium]
MRKAVFDGTISSELESPPSTNALREANKIDCMKMKHIRAIHIFLTISTLLLAASPAISEDASLSKQSTIPYSPPKKGFWKTLNDLFLPHYESRNVLFEKETAFHNISVEDDESGRRHLVFKPNHGSQGVILPNDPDKLVPNFMKYSFLAIPALERPLRSALFIGLGAGIMPRFVATKFPSVKMDIVEIDKDLKPIAEKYFAFKKNDDMKLFFEDGRYFINHCEEKYNIIILDAYSSVDIPFQFTTVEFFRNAKRCLADGGILVANLANFGRRDFLASEFKTVKSVFKHIAVVACPRNTNYVLFASEKPLFTKADWRESCRKFDEKSDWDFKLAPFLENRLSDKEIDSFSLKAKLLTDDFAPVNSMD